MGTETKRLKFADKKVPGPGSYIKNSTNESKVCSFAKSGVRPSTKKSGPGPGSYEIGSSIGELPSYCK
jgi:hypothetical protein